MKYKKLGNTSISISTIGAGTWAIGGLWWDGTDVKRSIDTIRASVDAGINFIDTAPGYGFGVSEDIIGKAIEGIRDKVVLATKCGLIWDREEGYFHFQLGDTKIYRNLKPVSIRKELEVSLKRLKTDYLDLYITHWQDPGTPIEETMTALLKLKDEGKIRAIGVSNASAAQMDEYLKFGELDADQEKYNLLENTAENENIPWCQANGATFLAYSALAQGVLTGTVVPGVRYKSDDIRSMNPLFEEKTVVKINDMLKKFFIPLTQKYNCTMTQLVIAALISVESVVALCGARNVAEAQENALAGDIEIRKEDLDILKKCVKDNFSL